MFMKIGFIGLGHMGFPMAKNLMTAGHRVSVFDISEKAIQSAVVLGATSADSIKILAQQSDAIITMLQTGQQVRDVCLGENGIFENARDLLLYMDCSSIEITTTRELHTLASQKKIGMLDAPVSGGVTGAELGTLTIMVGGEVKHFQRAEPILKLLGKKIIHAGQAGNGQAAKICNNLILGISMIAVSEGFSLAEKLGLEAKIFFDISSNASGQCWSMTNYCPVPNVIERAPSNQNYAPGFAAKMMLKDLRLAQHAAESVGGNIPLGAEATELYSLFVNQGFAEKDFSAIIKMINGK
ncbi:MAG: 3-hydroxyisobutyrate dehydrogenase [Gammaproteobacteria bacterium]|nr:3-hydroxyisobutyrate dehydrogenase [Gammaproteobacteria bacterium]